MQFRRGSIEPAGLSGSKNGASPGSSLAPSLRAWGGPQPFAFLERPERLLFSLACSRIRLGGPLPIEVAEQFLVPLASTIFSYQKIRQFFRVYRWRPRCESVRSASFRISRRCLNPVLGIDSSKCVPGHHLHHCLLPGKFFLEIPPPLWQLYGAAAGVVSQVVVGPYSPRVVFPNMCAAFGGRGPVFGSRCWWAVSGRLTASNPQAGRVRAVHRTPFK